MIIKFHFYYIFGNDSMIVLIDNIPIYIMCIHIQMRDTLV